MLDSSEHTYSKFRSVAILPAIIDQIRTEVRKSCVGRNFPQTILRDPVPGEMRLEEVGVIGEDCRLV